MQTLASPISHAGQSVDRRDAKKLPGVAALDVRERHDAHTILADTMLIEQPLQNNAKHGSSTQS